VLFEREKLPRCDSDHSSPSSAKVKNGGVIALLLHMFYGMSLDYIIKYRNKFTFTLHMLPNPQKQEKKMKKNKVLYDENNKTASEGFGFDSRGYQIF
jgi:hypothetical protein